MPSFILHDATGKAKNHVEVTHPSLLPTYDMEAGDAWIEAPFPPWQFDVAAEPDGSFRVVPRGEEPAALMLEVAKIARWAEAKAYRDERMNGGCVTPLGRVDSDPNSRSKINGAVTSAMLAGLSGQPFAPIAWTMADNSIVSHDAAEMIAMGQAVAAFVAACQDAGSAVRAAIAAATDKSAVAAVDIATGYP